MGFRILILFFLSFGIFIPKLHATHIVGGEITYRCLGDNNFEITLTVYRDCFNGQPPFDTVASIGVFDFLWSLKKELRIRYVKDDTIPVVLTDPCLAIPPGVCVHRSSYRAVVNLPYQIGGYHLAYQRCCRNQLIRNIPAPLTVGATYTASIGERSLQGCNNSARFNNWPPVAICVNKPIDFDHSATDPDGDSLVYKLCVPYEGADQQFPNPQPPNQGPYQEVTWLPPYGLHNVLGGQPVTIDPKTGFLTGVPNTIGNFVVGVCVEEYRAGRLISTTRRDFQYNVADCGVPEAAFFAPDTTCDNTTVGFENFSDLSTVYRWFFDWEGDRSLTSGQINPAFKYSKPGRYTVALIANPGKPCADTAFQVIDIVSSGMLLAYADPDTILRGDTTQLHAVLNDAIAFKWDAAPSLVDIAISAPQAWPIETTLYKVLATNNLGCTQTQTVLVVVLPPICDEPYIFFPNAFSPNGDGENDFLKLEGNLTEEVYWAVYNRWGEKVFEANTIDDAWDGRYKGQEQPLETYGYYLRVRCLGGRELKKKGNVTLLR